MICFWQPKLHDSYEPEVQLCLQSVMFYLSVFKTGATYGLRLMGLKYRDERRHWAHPTSFEDALPTLAQRLGWWLGHVGVRYAWAKVHRLSQREQWSELEDGHWKKTVWRSMEVLEKVYNALSLLNFLAFLSNGRLVIHLCLSSFICFEGSAAIIYFLHFSSFWSFVRYRSLVDRVLCLRLVYVRRQMNRQVDFDFLNRQLVWQGFTEFILFLMPFISFQSIRSQLLRLLPFKKGGDIELPPHICAICNATTVHTPYQTNCGHTYW